jgi:prophage regulatory protein
MVPMCAAQSEQEKRYEFPRLFRVSPRRVGWDADEVEA